MPPRARDARAEPATAHSAHASHRHACQEGFKLCTKIFKISSNQKNLFHHKEPYGHRELKCEFCTPFGCGSMTPWRECGGTGTASMKVYNFRLQSRARSSQFLQLDLGSTKAQDGFRGQLDTQDTPETPSAGTAQPWEAQLERAGLPVPVFKGRGLCWTADRRPGPWRPLWQPMGAWPWGCSGSSNTKVLAQEGAGVPGVCYPPPGPPHPW